MKDLTAQCELKAKEWDQRSVMRGNELKALEKAIDIVGPLSYRKFRAVEPQYLSTPFLSGFHTNYRITYRALSVRWKKNLKKARFESAKTEQNTFGELSGGGKHLCGAEKVGEELQILNGLASPRPAPRSSETFASGGSVKDTQGTRGCASAAVLAKCRKLYFLSICT